MKFIIPICFFALLSCGVTNKVLTHSDSTAYLYKSKIKIDTSYLNHKKGFDLTKIQSETDYYLPDTGKNHSLLSRITSRTIYKYQKLHDTISTHDTIYKYLSNKSNSTTVVKKASRGKIKDTTLATNFKIPKGVWYMSLFVIISGILFLIYIKIKKP